MRAVRQTVTTNKTDLRQKLLGPELAIFEDYAGCDGEHLFLSDGSQSCYIMFTKTRDWRFNWPVIHHISNVPLLLNNTHHVRLQLFRCNGTLRFMADARFLTGYPLPMARLQAMKRLLFYRSERLRAEQIDNACSELVLLPL